MNTERTNRFEVRPIVFIGPSMSHDEAHGILEADFRPPCRRGDIEQLPAGATVGLIDGVFDQSLSVSPREILMSIRRGVSIYGASSMGALRAAEVPEMRGIGRIYELFASEVIDNDDEVALLFDPDRLIALTVPLVNVRFSIERMIQSDTISTEHCSRILDAARCLHYSQRTYPAILFEAGYTREQIAELAPLLSQWDLKRADARQLLEHLARTPAPASSKCRFSSPPATDDHPVMPMKRLALRDNPFAPVSIWESGDRVAFEDLIDFLVVTNRIAPYADRALTKLLLSGGLADVEVDVGPVASLKPLLESRFKMWGWRTEEETKVTLADLGLGLRDLAESARGDAVIYGALATLLSRRHTQFLKLLRAELFLQDISLKRETMILGALQQCARAHDDDRPRNITGAAIISALHHTQDWDGLTNWCQTMGVTPERLQYWAAVLEAAAATAVGQFEPDGLRPDTTAIDARLKILERAVRPDGEQRFSLTTTEAHEHAQCIRRHIGVTRVGLVQGLTDLDGVFISQAARPGGAWSSTYGSGKSDSREGAIVGAIMEELEKWANERYVGDPETHSFESLERDGRDAVNPLTLDLPFDSVYSADLPIPWQRAADLMQGVDTLVPSASLACYFNAGCNNVFSSRRAGRVVFSTNGLASGFSLAEALIHATCEVIERHNAKLAELIVDNPGLTDCAIAPTAVRLEDHCGLFAIEARLRAAGFAIQAFDITIDIPVPTVLVRLIRNGRVSPGWGTHPNPHVAYQRALFEACQTLANVVAGGREDLTVHARSLGRHERPRPARAAADARWGLLAGRTRPLSTVGGHIDTHLYADFSWIRDRLWHSGLRRLIAVDLTTSEILPARVVRVVIPGLETTNPFYCGPRARRLLAGAILDRAVGRC